MGAVQGVGAAAVEPGGAREGDARVRVVIYVIGAVAVDGGDRADVAPLGVRGGDLSDQARGGAVLDPPQEVFDVEPELGAAAGFILAVADGVSRRGMISATAPTGPVGDRGQQVGDWRRGGRGRRRA